VCFVRIDLPLFKHSKLYLTSCDKIIVITAENNMKRTIAVHYSYGTMKLRIVVMGVIAATMKLTSISGLLYFRITKILLGTIKTKILLLVKFENTMLFVFSLLLGVIAADRSAHGYNCRCCCCCAYRRR